MNRINRRFYLRTFIAFLILWIPILGLLIADLRPEPIYQDLKTDGVIHNHLPRFESGQPLTIEFDAPKRDISAIYWLNLIPLSLQEVAISIENLTKGKEPIPIGSPDAKKLTSFDGRGFNEKGDRIRITIRWVRETPPAVWVANSQPARPVTTTENGKPLDFSPVLYLGQKNPKKRSQPDPSLALYPDNVATEKYPLSSGVPLVITSEAPTDNLEMLILPNLLSGEEKATIRVTAINRTTGEELKKFSTRIGSDFSRLLPKEKISKGDEIAVELLWEESPPPRIQQAMEPPLTMLEVRDGDDPTEIRPIFLVQYRWPTRYLFWLWLAVPVLLIWSLRSETKWAESGLIVALASAAFITGALAWQQNFSHQHMHLDPDRYGTFGEKIVDWLTQPETRLGNEAWIKNYPHAHVPLTPIITGIGILLGMAKSTAYLTLVGISTISTLLLLHYHLRKQLELPKAVVLFGMLLFTCHLFFLKAAGRPSTDALGLTLLVATIVTLTARIHDGGWKNGLLLTCLLLLGALARPPGLVYFVPVLALALGIDWWREGQLRFWKRIRTGFEIALPAVVILAILYFNFDWFHSQKLAMKKSEEFHEFSTLPLFLRCLPPLLGLMPIAWFWLRHIKERDHLFAIVIYATWLVFYLAMLWLVKAPFLTRLMLPAIPAVVLLTILGISKMNSRTRTVAFAIIAIVAILSLGIMHYLIGLPFLPPSNISPFIY